MVAINRLKDVPWSIEKQRAAEQWLRENPPEQSGYCRGLIVGLVYGTALGVILQSAWGW